MMIGRQLDNQIITFNLSIELSGQVKMSEHIGQVSDITQKETVTTIKVIG